MDNLKVNQLIDDLELLKALRIHQELTIPTPVHQYKKFFIEKIDFWYADVLSATNYNPYLKELLIHGPGINALDKFIRSFTEKSILYIQTSQKVTIDISDLMKMGTSNILIIAPLDAQATIYFDPSKAHANVFNIEITTGENAYIKFHISHENAGHLYGSFSSRIGKNSLVRIEHYQSSGNELFFFDYILHEKNSRLEHQTLSVLQAGMTQGLITNQRHGAENTASNIVIKTIHAEDARSFYRGTINIDKQGSQSVAHQHHRALMLDPRSYTCAIPSLQVENHDVQCSHGTAAAHFDEQQLWYLQSRGLEAFQAREMLMVSFLTHKPIFDHDKILLDHILKNTRKLLTT